IYNVLYYNYLRHIGSKVRCHSERSEESSSVLELTPRFWNRFPPSPLSFLSVLLSDFLHPFNAPIWIPLTNHFCPITNTKIIGRIIITDPAMSSVHCVLYIPMNVSRPSGSVFIESCVSMISGQ